MKNEMKRYFKTIMNGVKGEVNYHYKKHKLEPNFKNKTSDLEENINIEKEKIDKYIKKINDLSFKLNVFSQEYNFYKENFNSYDEFKGYLDERINEMCNRSIIEKYGDLSTNSKVYTYIYENNEEFKKEIESCTSKEVPNVFLKYKTKLDNEILEYRKSFALQKRNYYENAFGLEDESKGFSISIEKELSEALEKKKQAVTKYNEKNKEYHDIVKNIKEFEDEKKKHLCRMNKLSKKAKDVKKMPFNALKKMKCFTQASYYRNLASKGKKSLCSLGIIGKYFDFDAKHEYKGYSIENPKLFKNVVSKDNNFNLKYNFIPNKNKSLFSKENNSVEVHLPLEICSDGTYKYNMDKINFAAKESGNVRKREVKNMKKFIEDNAFRMSMDEVRDFTGGEEIMHSVTKTEDGYPCQVWTCNGKVVFEAREVKVSRGDGSYETRYTCYKGMNILEDSGKKLPIQVNIGDLNKLELNKHFRMFNLYAKENSKDIKLEDDNVLGKDSSKDEFENTANEEVETHKNKEDVEVEL